MSTKIFIYYLVYLDMRKLPETEVYIHLPYYKFNDMSHISVINELFPKVKENET